MARVLVVESGVLLNVEEALEFAGGNRALLKQLIGMFLEECAGWGPAARQAIAAGNATTVRRIGHTVRGATAQLAAGPAALAAARLEALAQAGNLTEAPAACDALEEQLRLLRPALEQLRAEC
jgi:HPt (histidine-containing phosphotransfer) domain-containing protein